MVSLSSVLGFHYTLDFVLFKLLFVVLTPLPLTYLQDMDNNPNQQPLPLSLDIDYCSRTNKLIKEADRKCASFNVVRPPFFTMADIEQYLLLAQIYDLFKKTTDKLNLSRDVMAELIGLQPEATAALAELMEDVHRIVCTISEDPAEQDNMDKWREWFVELWTENARGEVQQGRGEVEPQNN